MLIGQHGGLPLAEARGVAKSSCRGEGGGAARPDPARLPHAAPALPYISLRAVSCSSCPAAARPSSTGTLPGGTARACGCPPRRPPRARPAPAVPGHCSPGTLPPSAHCHSARVTRAAATDSGTGTAQVRYRPASPVPRGGTGASTSTAGSVTSRVTPSPPAPRPRRVTRFGETTRLRHISRRRGTQECPPRSRLRPRHKESQLVPLTAGYTLTKLNSLTPIRRPRSVPIPCSHARPVPKLHLN